MPNAHIKSNSTKKWLRHSSDLNFTTLEFHSITIYLFKTVLKGIHIYKKKSTLK